MARKRRRGCHEDGAGAGTEQHAARMPAASRQHGGAGESRRHTAAPPPPHTQPAPCHTCSEPAETCALRPVAPHSQPHARPPLIPACVRRWLPSASWPTTWWPPRRPRTGSPCSPWCPPCWPCWDERCRRGRRHLLRCAPAACRGGGQQGCLARMQGHVAFLQHGVPVQCSPAAGMRVNPAERCLQDAIELLIEVGDAHPKFLRKNLAEVVDAMLQVGRVGGPPPPGGGGGGCRGRRGQLHWWQGQQQLFRLHHAAGGPARPFARHCAAAGGGRGPPGGRHALAGSRVPDHAGGGARQGGRAGARSRAVDGAAAIATRAARAHQRK